MPAKLETEQLTYEVGTERLVDGVSLTIEAKSTVAIIGPSGAGKSSLLRLLNRLNEPTDRTVMYDGQDYRELDPQQLRTHIGLVPQDSAFIDGTVWENVTLGPRLRNEAVDQQRARTLLVRDVIQAV